MKILLWGAVALISYSYFKKQTIAATIHQLLSGGATLAGVNPNQSISNTSPYFGMEATVTQPGSPGTPPGSLQALFNFIRTNESGGPYTGAQIAI